MKKEDAYWVIDEAQKMGIFQVIIEGGEPTLHKSFFDIVEYSLSQGFETNVVSNGTVITERFAVRFKEAVDRHKAPLGLQVSLDSIRPEINDNTRGKTQLVMRGIENLLKAGVSISLGVVVTHSNVKFLKEIVMNYYPRVKRYHFIGLMPTWKSLSFSSELRLTPEDYDYLAEVDSELSELMLRNPDLEVTILKDKDDFPHVKEDSAKIVCNAGFHQLIVMPDLTVTTCDIAPDVIVGDLTKETLQVVWNGSVLTKVRNMGVPPCIYNCGKKGARGEDVALIIPDHIRQ